MRIFEQDLLDKRVVTVDFSSWLGGSSIVSVAWVVASELTASDEDFTVNSATNYFENSTGLEDGEYEVACTITTDEAVPRKKTQRFIIKLIKAFD